MFKRMAVVYRRIEEKLAHVAHISSVQYRISVSYLLRFFNRDVNCIDTKLNINWKRYWCEKVIFNKH